MSVFTERNHLFARKPSDAGDPAAMRAAGFGALFCNIGDYPAEEWESLRQRALAEGMACGPWLRTADAHGSFALDRLRYLIDTADAWNWSPLIVNSEKEIDYTGDDLTSVIADEVGDRDAAISMEVRPFGAVDWSPLRYYPILPQSFPAETGIADTDDAIRENWYRAGVECVVVTYGSYGGMEPDEFARLTPYGVYTADDCGNQFARWASLGTCEPCRDTPPNPNGGETMEKVPAGAYDDVARLLTDNVKRPDGKDATAFNSQRDSLKATREAVNELIDRVARLEEGS